MSQEDKETVQYPASCLDPDWPIAKAQKDGEPHIGVYPRAATSFEQYALGVDAAEPEITGHTFRHNRIWLYPYDGLEL